MAEQNLLAKLGLRLGVLGSAASLAIAAPLATGNYDPACSTSVDRIGAYFDRTPGLEKIGLVVMGTEILSVGVDSVTATAKIITAASVLAHAGLNLPPGTAPTAPVDGDLWTTTAALFVRINGATVSIGNISGTLAANQVAFGSGANAIQGSNQFTYTTFLTANPVAATLPSPPSGTSIFFCDGDSNGAISRIHGQVFMGTGGGYVSFSAQAARGTSGAPSAIQSGDEIVHLSARGYGATGYSAASRGFISIFAAENWTDAAQGTRIALMTTTPGTTTTSEKLRLWGDGGLTLGSAFVASPGAFYISVAGNAAVGGATAVATTAMQFPASVVGASSFNAPHGVAPTAPVNGDFWTTTTGAFVRINGSTTPITGTNQIKRTITLRAVVDSGVLATGAQKINLPLAIAGTITAWRLTADVATNATIDVWKRAGSLPTVANTIIDTGSGGVEPNLVAATVSSGGVTNWFPGGLAVVAGDIIEMNIDANSAASALTLVLEMNVTA